MTAQIALDAPPSPAEAAVLATLDAAAMLDRTLAWAAINSGSRNLAGLTAMAETLSPALAALGPVTRVAATPASTVDASGTTQPLAHGDSLHLVVRPDAATRVLLTGHMDTVFGPDHPFQATRWLDRDTLNGPGVADMKGGIAVMLAALAAVLASPFGAGLGVEVVLNADEEVSSPGSAALLAAAAARCHLGLTYEPALPDGTLAGARAGSGNFSATVRGRAAHAGREPEKGRNAVVAAADLALRLAALARPGCSVNPAKIDGGGPNNIVPDIAVLRFNVRPRRSPTRPPPAPRSRPPSRRWRRRTTSASPSTAASPGRRSRWTPTSAAPSTLSPAAARRSASASRGATPAGCATATTSPRPGLAVVDTMGVRGGAIHSADEYVVVDSFAERAHLSALVLLRVAQRLRPGRVVTRREFSR